MPHQRASEEFSLQSRALINVNLPVTLPALPVPPILSPAENVATRLVQVNGQPTSTPAPAPGPVPTQTNNPTPPTNSPGPSPPSPTPTNNNPGNSPRPSPGANTTNQGTTSTRGGAEPLDTQNESTAQGESADPRGTPRLPSSNDDLNNAGAGGTGGTGGGGSNSGLSNAGFSDADRASNGDLAADGSDGAVSSNPGRTPMGSGTFPAGDPRNTDTAIPGSETGAKGVDNRGIIAGAIIVALLAGFVLLFVVRRRWKSKGAERRTRWWLFKNSNSQLYNDVESDLRRSSGSSFSTPYDRAQRPLSHFALFQPPQVSPDMTQVQNLEDPFSNTGITGADPITNNRFSVGSAASSKDSHFSVLHYQGRASLDTAEAGFDNPSSPRAHAFSFPKPPSHHNSLTSRASSERGSTSSNQLSSIGEESARGNADPFADSTTSLPRSSQLLENPFADTAVSTSSTIPQFHRICTVLRPFIATLPDELSVRPNEKVKVVQAFDDGWTVVEKTELETGVGAQRGMVPAMCLADF